MRHFEGLICATLVAMGCSATPSTADDSPTEEAANPASAVREGAPAAADTTPTPTPAAAAVKPTCPTLTDEAGFASWRELLMSHVNTGDLAAAKRTIQCAQPAFAAELIEQSAEWLVDATPRHLDEDPDEEFVLQFRQYSQVMGHGERDELVWLAIYDRKDGTYQAAGVIVRPKHPACVLADDEGIKIEFGEHAAGPDAQMIWTEQDVKACGTLVDVSYTKTSHKLELGKLVSMPLKPPKSKSYSRTKGAVD